MQVLKGNDGVIDGARTRDNRNHNPGLYQLSYDHHLVTREMRIIENKSSASKK